MSLREKCLRQQQQQQQQQQVGELDKAAWWKTWQQRFEDTFWLNSEYIERCSCFHMGHSENSCFYSLNFHFKVLSQNILSLVRYYYDISVIFAVVVAFMLAVIYFALEVWIAASLNLHILLFGDHMFYILLFLTHSLDMSSGLLYPV